MRLLQANTRRDRRHLRASSIVEIMIASTIAIMATGSLLMLVVQVGKEQRQTLAEASLQQDAGIVQDKLSILLRQMSVTESVIYTDAVTGQPGLYRKIIMAKGEAPDFPREEVWFDPNALTLYHDPDRNTSGNTLTMFGTNNLAVIRNLYFYPSMKASANPDSTTVNMILEVDDNGNAGELDEAGNPSRVSIFRYFTIKLRNH